MTMAFPSSALIGKDHARSSDRRHGGARTKNTKKCNTRQGMQDVVDLALQHSTHQCAHLGVGRWRREKNIVFFTAAAGAAAVSLYLDRFSAGRVFRSIVRACGMTTAVLAVCLVIRTSTANDTTKNGPTGGKWQNALMHDRVIWRQKRSVGGSIRKKGAKGKHSDCCGGIVLNKARKVHSTEMRPTFAVLREDLVRDNCRWKIGPWCRPYPRLPFAVRLVL
jgi:hypothetical protein